MLEELRESCGMPGQSQQEQIVFFDTTLRDGEQSPGCTMHSAEKLRLAHQIAGLGVDILEAGLRLRRRAIRSLSGRLRARSGVRGSRHWRVASGRTLRRLLRG